MEYQILFCSACFSCIKIHVEMAEKLQVKDLSFIFTDVPVHMRSFFTFSF